MAKKFSDLDATTSLEQGDLFAVAQVDENADTGYSSKKITSGNVAKSVLNEFGYPTALPSFEDPTITGGLEELKADIKALLPVSSASGNPCTFDTDISDTLVSLKSAIVASGGYDADTQTSHPIVGHSELNLVRCGKNLIRDEFVSGLPSTNIGDDYDTIITSTRYAYLNLPNINGNVTVSITDFDANYIDWVILFGYTNGKLAGKHQINNFSGSTINLSGYDHLRIIIGAVAGYTVPSAISTVGKVQLELGSSSSAYAPYNGTPYLVSFGQTVYGGEYDANAGKVRITYGVDNLSDLNWSYSSGDGWFQVYHNTHKYPQNSAVCSYYPVVYILGSGFVNESIAVVSNYLAIKDSSFGSDVDALKTALSGQQICYELATPIEIDVSSISVDTIVGTNNIVSDGGGDVEVSYREGIQHYIDKKIAETQALIL